MTPANIITVLVMAAAHTLITEFELVDKSL